MAQPNVVVNEDAVGFAYTSNAVPAILTKCLAYYRCARVCVLRMHMLAFQLRACVCAWHVQVFVHDRQQLNASIDAGNFVSDEYNMQLYADLEQRVDDVLVAANRHPQMTGLMMDWMERWRRLGGAEFSAGLLSYPVTSCTLPNNCGTYGLTESAVASSRKLDALRVCVFLC